ncbi:MAG: hypothetical protein IPG45_16045 [Deltaproteobacteria bacterium]|nr:hypothetical protein [Deltaproteobacteria bacterium]
MGATGPAGPPGMNGGSPDLAPLEARVAAIEAGDLADQLAALTSRTDQLEAALTAQSAELVALRQQLAQAPTVIAADRTLTVTANPSGADQFADLPAALASLARSWISPGVRVTISITGNQPFVHGRPIVIDHPQSERIFIQGASATPPILIFDGSGQAGDDAFTVGSGAVLNLDRVALSWVGPVCPTRCGVAVHATWGGVAHVGPDVSISGFHIGLYAEFAGAIRADGIEITNTVFSISSAYGSVISAQDGRIQGAGAGLEAFGGAVLLASDSRVEAGNNGLQGGVGGVVICDRCAMANNTVLGFTAGSGALVVANFSSASGSDTCYGASEGGTILANGATTNGCDQSYSPAPGPNPGVVVRP